MQMIRHDHECQGKSQMIPFTLPQNIDEHTGMLEAFEERPALLCYRGDQINLSGDGNPSPAHITGMASSFLVHIAPPCATPR